MRINVDPDPKTATVERTNPGRLPGLHDDSRVRGDVLAQYTARLRVLLHNENLYFQ
jgi:hypothetical protein